MQQLKRAVHGAPITMLSHSAGGWLGRVYLKEFGTAGVDRFVSLGSPHQAPPTGVMDQTRGILTWVNAASPDNFHPEVSYTTIAGKFIKGVDPLRGDGPPLAKFAGAGYSQAGAGCQLAWSLVCGRADVWGDVIVPVPCAHLGGGTTNLDLEGVFHSPLGENLPFFGAWYGSEQVLPRWVHHLDGSSPDVAEAEAEAEKGRERVVAVQEL
ncbi:hypothetical protein QJQ45_019934 [Haematococcus lacustris]|nr:hypothetical protein QJQ45_019934 [Haematococcus lacustris]